ncbi:dynein heavy chain protein [Perkinsela sp. CCAP 1560/4]|nr:dynein heavy chain protein [Perkinsela sp. CCAP 1560/4]|eukprot:KNH07148.1 dynein heavy chain protein [Perkinsela sp. CCAP 1560/4]
MRFHSPFVKVKSAVENLENIKAAIQVSKTVLVVGPQGSGKTHTIHACAEQRFGDTHHVLPALLDETSDSSDLIGGLVCSPQPGQLVWEDGPMLRAMRDGSWLLLEDIDLLSYDVLTTLTRLRDDTDSFYVSGVGHITVHKDFRVIGTVIAKEGGECVRMADQSTDTNYSTSLSFLKSNLSRKSHIDVIQWLAIPFLLPTLVEIHEILVFLHGDVFDSSLIKDLLVDPFIRFASTISSIQNRQISFRDILKIARRVRLSTAIPLKSQQIRHVSEALRKEILFNFIEVMFAAVQSTEKRVGIIQDACTFFGCGGKVVDDYLSRLPALSFRAQDEAVDIGRANYRASPNYIRKRMKNRDLSLSFAPTKSTMRTLESILHCVQYGEPVLLTGDTGIGKTYAVTALAEICCPTKLVVVNLSQNTEYTDFIGGWKPQNLARTFSSLYENFHERFEAAFDKEKNKSFLQALHRSYARLMSHESAGDESHVQNDRKRFLRLVESGCRTALEKLRNLTEKDEKRWNDLYSSAQATMRHVDDQQGGLSFEYQEGILRECQKQGHWLLLDEINLAPSEVLDRIGAAIGDVDADSSFHLFACMNPTGTGKKLLPTSLQSRFTTLLVEEPREKDDLILLTKHYLAGAIENPPCDALVNFFDSIRSKSNAGILSDMDDGSIEPPTYSVRSFCRALSFCVNNTKKCGFPRAIRDGLLMTFATQLSPKHQIAVERDIDNFIFPNETHTDGKMGVSQLIERYAKHSLSAKQFQLEHFAIPLGPIPSRDIIGFVVTPTVYCYLRNIMRCVVAMQPVLLQGPTSAGKTSMVEYLARRAGYEFVRINNHKCMEVADYFGQYVQGTDGSINYVDGPLVAAVRKGAWVVLDELNLAPSEVLEALNRLLDDNRELFVPETQERITPHKSFRLFATQNPQKWKGSTAYGGRHTLSKAFLNRFMLVRVDDMPIHEVGEMLKSPAFGLPTSFVDRMLKVMEELQLVRSQANILDGKTSYITPRDLFKWAKRCPRSLQELAGHGLFLFGEKCRKEFDRMTVKRVLSKHCGFGERVVRTSNRFNVVFEKVCSDIEAWEELREFLPSLRIVLEKYAMVITEEIMRLLVFMGLCLVYNEPVLLVGETGSGKTTACQIWAEVLDRPMFVINCHQHTETSDLIGSFYPVHEESSENEKRLFEWRDGPVTSAMRDGGIILLDEVNLAEENVIERLNSVLDHSRSLTLTEKGGSLSDRVVSAHKNFRLLATMNPGGDFGKKELSTALRNRFSECYVSWYPTKDEIEQCISLHLKRLIPEATHETLVPLIISKVAPILEHRTTNQSMRGILAFVEFIGKSLLRETNGFSHQTIDNAIRQGQVLLQFFRDNEERQQLSEYEQQVFSWEALPHIGSPLNFSMSDIGKFDPSLADYHINTQASKVNISRVLRAMVLDERPILLEGPAGVGKTTLISLLSLAHTGNPVVRINLSEQSDWMDLIGTFIPVSDTTNTHSDGPKECSFQWNDGMLLSAVRQGMWVVLDELNLAPQSVLEGLNSLLDHRRSLFLPEFSQYVHAGKGFRIFASQNPTSDGGGRKGLPKSLLNRFLVVPMEQFGMADLRKILHSTKSSALRECSEEIQDSVLSEELVNGLFDGIERLHMQERSSRSMGREAQTTPATINLRDILRWVELTVKECKSLRNVPQHFHLHEHPYFMIHILYFTVVQRIQTSLSRSEAMRILSHSIAKSFSLNRGFDCSSMEKNILENFMASWMAGRWQAVDINTLALNGIPFRLPEGSVDFPGNSDCSMEYAQSNMSPDYCLVPSQAPLLTAILISTHHSTQPIILNGSSGVGKTSVVLTAAQTVGRKVHTLHLSAGCDTIDLLGGFQQSSNIDQSQSIFQWRDSLLVKAVEEGDWLIIENANFIPCSVLDRLNPLCEQGGVLVLNEQGRMADGSIRVIRPHPNFRIFFTVNPAFGELSKAMRNRGLELRFTGYSHGSEDHKMEATNISLISLVCNVAPDMPFGLCEALVNMHVRRHGTDKEIYTLLRASRSWSMNQACNHNSDDSFHRILRLMYLPEDVREIQGYISHEISSNENQTDENFSFSNLPTALKGDKVSRLVDFDTLNLQRCQLAFYSCSSPFDIFVVTLAALFDNQVSSRKHRLDLFKTFVPEPTSSGVCASLEVAWKLADNCGYDRAISEVIYEWFLSRQLVNVSVPAMLCDFIREFQRSVESSSGDGLENASWYLDTLVRTYETNQTSRKLELHRLCIWVLVLQAIFDAKLFSHTLEVQIEVCTKKLLDHLRIPYFSHRELLKSSGSLTYLGISLPDLEDGEACIDSMWNSPHLENTASHSQNCEQLLDLLLSVAQNRSQFVTAETQRLLSSELFSQSLVADGFEYVQSLFYTYANLVDQDVRAVSSIKALREKVDSTRQPQSIQLECEAAEVLLRDIFSNHNEQVSEMVSCIPAELHLLFSPQASPHLRAACLWTWLGIVLCQILAPRSPIHDDLKQYVKCKTDRQKYDFWTQKLLSIEKSLCITDPGYDSCLLHDAIRSRIQVIQCIDTDASLMEIDENKYFDFFSLQRAFLQESLDEHRVQTLFHGIAESSDTRKSLDIEHVELMLSAGGALRNNLLGDEWRKHVKSAGICSGLTVLLHGLSLWKQIHEQSSLQIPPAILIDTLSFPSGVKKLGLTDVDQFLACIDRHIQTVENTPWKFHDHVQGIFDALTLSMRRSNVFYLASPDMYEKLSRSLIDRLSFIQKTCYQMDSNANQKRNLSVKFYGEGANQIEEFSTVDEGRTDGKDAYRALTSTWDVDGEDEELNQKKRNHKAREQQAQCIRKALDGFVSYEDQCLNRNLSKFFHIGNEDIAWDRESQQLSGIPDENLEMYKNPIFDLKGYNSIIDERTMLGWLAGFSHCLRSKEKFHGTDANCVVEEITAFPAQFNLYRESSPAEFLMAKDGICAKLLSEIGTRCEDNESDEWIGFLHAQLTAFCTLNIHEAPFIEVIHRMEALFKSVYELATAHADHALQDALAELASICVRWRKIEVHCYSGKLLDLRSEIGNLSAYERWLPFRALLRELLAESESPSESNMHIHDEKLKAFACEAERGFQNAGIGEIEALLAIMKGLGEELLNEEFEERSEPDEFQQPTNVVRRRQMRNWLLNKSSQYSILLPLIHETIDAKERQIRKMVNEFSETMKWSERHFHHTMACAEKSQAFLGRIYHMYKEALMRPMCELIPALRPPSQKLPDCALSSLGDFSFLKDDLLTLRMRVQESREALESSVENKIKRNKLNAVRDLLRNARLGAQALPTELRRWICTSDIKDIHDAYINTPHPLCTSMGIPTAHSDILDSYYHSQLIFLSNLRTVSTEKLAAGNCTEMYNLIETFTENTHRNRQLLHLCAFLFQKARRTDAEVYPFATVSAYAALLSRLRLALLQVSEMEETRQHEVTHIIRLAQSEANLLRVPYVKKADLPKHIENVRFLMQYTSELIEKIQASEVLNNPVRSMLWTLGDLQVVLCTEGRRLSNEVCSVPSVSTQLSTVSHLLSCADVPQSSRKRTIISGQAEINHGEIRYLSDIPRYIFTKYLSRDGEGIDCRNEFWSSQKEELLSDFACMHALELEILTSLSMLVRQSAQMDLNDTEEGENDGAEGLQDGTGMGEGRGEEDITDKMTNEDQLMDANDQQANPDNDRENIDDEENKENEVTVTSKFEGNTFSESESGSGSDNESVASDNEEGKTGENEKNRDEAEDPVEATEDQEANGDGRADPEMTSTTDQTDTRDPQESKGEDDTRLHEADDVHEEEEGNANSDNEDTAKSMEIAEEAEISDAGSDSSQTHDEMATDAETEDPEDGSMDGKDGVECSSEDESADEEKLSQTQEQKTADQSTSASQPNESQQDGTSTAGDSKAEQDTESKSAQSQGSRHATQAHGSSFTEFQQGEHNASSTSEKNPVAGPTAEFQQVEFAETIVDFHPDFSAQSSENTREADAFMMNRKEDNNDASTYRRGLSREAQKESASSVHPRLDTPADSLSEGQQNPETRPPPPEYIEHPLVERATRPFDTAAWEDKVNSGQMIAQTAEPDAIDAEWTQVQARMAPLAHQLCENLRTILEPTISDRLKGDYKTGKRLNIKKLIPYIASNYQKNKIWLRRTMPSRRSYQVAVVIDDSYSMAVNSVSMACVECISLLITALHNLEAGELAVMALGSEMKICHSFEDPFDCTSVGEKCMRDLRFHQQRTNFQRFLTGSLDYMDEHRSRASSSSRGLSGEVMQLMFIISDGQITEDWAAIRQLTARANLNNQLIVFILLDTAEGDDSNGSSVSKGRQSVMNMESIEIDTSGKVIRRPYLENFPFPFYVVVQDISSTPDVVAEIVKQWLCDSVSTSS